MGVMVNTGFNVNVKVRGLNQLTKLKSSIGRLNMSQSDMTNSMRISSTAIDKNMRSAKNIMAGLGVSQVFYSLKNVLTETADQMSRIEKSWLNVKSLGNESMRKGLRSEVTKIAMKFNVDIPESFKDYYTTASIIAPSIRLSEKEKREGNVSLKNKKITSSVKTYEGLLELSKNISGDLDVTTLAKTFKFFKNFEDMKTLSLPEQLNEFKRQVPAFLKLYQGEAKEALSLYSKLAGTLTMGTKSSAIASATIASMSSYFGPELIGRQVKANVKKAYKTRARPIKISGMLQASQQSLGYIEQQVVDTTSVKSIGDSYKQIHNQTKGSLVKAEIRTKDLFQLLDRISEVAYDYMGDSTDYKRYNKSIEIFKDKYTQSGTSRIVMPAFVLKDFENMIGKKGFITEKMLSNVNTLMLQNQEAVRSDLLKKNIGDFTGDKDVLKVLEKAREAGLTDATVQTFLSTPMEYSKKNFDKFGGQGIYDFLLRKYSKFYIDSLYDSGQGYDGARTREKGQTLLTNRLQAIRGANFVGIQLELDNILDYINKYSEIKKGVKPADYTESEAYRYDTFKYFFKTQMSLLISELPVFQKFVNFFVGLAEKLKSLSKKTKDLIKTGSTLAIGTLGTALLIPLTTFLKELAIPARLFKGMGVAGMSANILNLAGRLSILFGAFKMFQAIKGGDSQKIKHYFDTYKKHVLDLVDTVRSSAMKLANSKNLKKILNGMSGTILSMLKGVHDSVGGVRNFVLNTASKLRGLFSEHSGTLDKLVTLSKKLGYVAGVAFGKATIVAIDVFITSIETLVLMFSKLTDMVVGMFSKLSSIIPKSWKGGSSGSGSGGGKESSIDKKNIALIAGRYLKDVVGGGLVSAFENSATLNTMVLTKMFEYSFISPVRRVLMLSFARMFSTSLIQLTSLAEGFHNLLKGSFVKYKNANLLYAIIGTITDSIKFAFKETLNQVKYTANGFKKSFKDVKDVYNINYNKTPKQGKSVVSRVAETKAGSKVVGAGKKISAFVSKSNFKEVSFLNEVKGFDMSASVLSQGSGDIVKNYNNLKSVRASLLKDTIDLKQLTVNRKFIIDQEQALSRKIDSQTGGATAKQVKGRKEMLDRSSKVSSNIDILDRKIALQKTNATSPQLNARNKMALEVESIANKIKQLDKTVALQTGGATDSQVFAGKQMKDKINNITDKINAKEFALGESKLKILGQHKEMKSLISQVEAEVEAFVKIYPSLKDKVKPLSDEIAKISKNSDAFSNIDTLVDEYKSFTKVFEANLGNVEIGKDYKFQSLSFDVDKYFKKTFLKYQDKITESLNNIKIGSNIGDFSNITEDTVNLHSKKLYEIYKTNPSAFPVEISDHLNNRPYTSKVARAGEVASSGTFKIFKKLAEKRWEFGGRKQFMFDDKIWTKEQAELRIEELTNRLNAKEGSFTEMRSKWTAPKQNYYSSRKSIYDIPSLSGIYQSEGYKGHRPGQSGIAYLKDTPDDIQKDINITLEKYKNKINQDMAIKKYSDNDVVKYIEEIITPKNALVKQYKNNMQNLDNTLYKSMHGLDFTQTYATLSKSFREIFDEQGKDSFRALITKLQLLKHGDLQDTTQYKNTYLLLEGKFSEVKEMYKDVVKFSMLKDSLTDEEIMKTKSLKQELFGYTLSDRTVEGRKVPGTQKLVVRRIKQIRKELKPLHEKNSFKTLDENFVDKIIKNKGFNEKATELINEPLRQSYKIKQLMNELIYGKDFKDIPYRHTSKYELGKGHVRKLYDEIQFTGTSKLKEQIKSYMSDRDLFYSDKKMYTRETLKESKLISEETIQKTLDILDSKGRKKLTERVDLILKTLESDKTLSKSVKAKQVLAFVDNNKTLPNNLRFSSKIDGMLKSSELTYTSFSERVLEGASTRYMKALVEEGEKYSMNDAVQEKYISKQTGVNNVHGTHSMSNNMNHIDAKDLKGRSLLDQTLLKLHSGDYKNLTDAQESLIKNYAFVQQGDFGKAVGQLSLIPAEDKQLKLLTDNIKKQEPALNEGLKQITSKTSMSKTIPFNMELPETVLPANKVKAISKAIESIPVAKIEKSFIPSEKALNNSIESLKKTIKAQRIVAKIRHDFEDISKALTQTVSPIVEISDALTKSVEEFAFLTKIRHDFEDISKALTQVTSPTVKASDALTKSVYSSHWQSLVGAKDENLLKTFRNKTRTGVLGQVPTRVGNTILNELQSESLFTRELQSKGKGKMMRRQRGTADLYKSLKNASVTSSYSPSATSSVDSSLYSRFSKETISNNKELLILDRYSKSLNRYNVLTESLQANKRNYLTRLASKDRELLTLAKHSKLLNNYNVLADSVAKNNSDKLVQSKMFATTKTASSKGYLNKLHKSILDNTSSLQGNWYGLLPSKDNDMLKAIKSKPQAKLLTHGKYAKGWDDVVKQNNPERLYRKFLAKEMDTVIAIDDFMNSANLRDELFKDINETIDLGISKLKHKEWRSRQKSFTKVRLMSVSDVFAEIHNNKNFGLSSGYPGEVKTGYDRVLLREWKAKQMAAKPGTLSAENLKKVNSIKDSTYAYMSKFISNDKGIVEGLNPQAEKYYKRGLQLGNKAEQSKAVAKKYIDSIMTKTYTPSSVGLEKMFGNNVALKNAVKRPNMFPKGFDSSFENMQKTMNVQNDFINDMNKASQKWGVYTGEKFKGRGVIPIKEIDGLNKGIASLKEGIKLSALDLVFAGVDVAFLTHAIYEMTTLEETVSNLSASSETLNFQLGNTNKQYNNQIKQTNLMYNTLALLATLSVPFSLLIGASHTLATFGLSQGNVQKQQKAIRAFEYGSDIASYSVDRTRNIKEDLMLDVQLGRYDKYKQYENLGKAEDTKIYKQMLALRDSKTKTLNEEKRKANQEVINTGDTRAAGMSGRKALSNYSITRNRLQPEINDLTSGMKMLKEQMIKIDKLEGSDKAIALKKFEEQLLNKSYDNPFTAIVKSLSLLNGKTASVQFFGRLNANIGRLATQEEGFLEGQDVKSKALLGSMYYGRSGAEMLDKTGLRAGTSMLQVSTDEFSNYKSFVGTSLSRLGMLDKEYLNMNKALSFSKDDLEKQMYQNLIKDNRIESAFLIQSLEKQYSNNSNLVKSESEAKEMYGYYYKRSDTGMASFTSMSDKEMKERIASKNNMLSFLGSDLYLQKKRNELLDADDNVFDNSTNNILFEILKVNTDQLSIMNTDNTKAGMDKARNEYMKQNYSEEMSMRIANSGQQSIAQYKERLRAELIEERFYSNAVTTSRGLVYEREEPDFTNNYNKTQMSEHGIRSEENLNKFVPSRSDDYLFADELASILSATKENSEYQRQTAENTKVSADIAKDQLTVSKYRYKGKKIVINNDATGMTNALVAAIRAGQNVHEMPNTGERVSEAPLK